MTRALSSPAAASDQELIALIANGNLQALGGLFDRYESDIRRFVGRLGVAGGDVDEPGGLRRGRSRGSGRCFGRLWRRGCYRGGSQTPEGVIGIDRAAERSNDPSSQLEQSHGMDQWTLPDRI